MHKHVCATCVSGGFLSHGASPFENRKNCHLNLHGILWWSLSWAARLGPWFTNGVTGLCWVFFETQFLWWNSDLSQFQKWSCCVCENVWINIWKATRSMVERDVSLTWKGQNSNAANNTWARYVVVTVWSLLFHRIVWWTSTKNNPINPIFQSETPTPYGTK